ncbi:hypothetical protein CW354_18780 [Marinicaulis flavus]|uniref:Uncharacterized protein n=1 Tax=Hyphococcus luteus TaxID=2058213 RepID=A0A2S7K1J8_9PROT|nr:hypothetical protein CW354_18780 [Marinicaulis flavus]
MMKTHGNGFTGPVFYIVVGFLAFSFDARDLRRRHFTDILPCAGAPMFEITEFSELGACFDCACS